MTARSPRLIVSVHDVAPDTLDACRRWVWHLDARGLPATLLAVPGPWRGPPMSDHRATTDWLWARASGGDEISLHGWSHRSDDPKRSVRSVRSIVGRCIARGAEEFWALDARTAADRVHRGLAVLEAADLAPVGFTPPGWLIGPNARHAVRACGLGYIADHRGATGFETGVRLAAPALSHRPNGLGERAGARAMSAIVRYRIAAGADVRIALHPDDLARPLLVDTTLSAIDEALVGGAQPTTYGAALGLLQASS